MLKFCSMFKRRSGLSVEEFQSYWRDQHAALVAALPGTVRYVQSHPLPGGYRKGELPYDGVAEFWCEDPQALSKITASEEYAAVMADEARLTDVSRTMRIMVEEHVIKDGPVADDGLKNIEFVTRKPGMNDNDFHTYWRDVHGPIAAEIPMIRRYVQAHATERDATGERQTGCDGLAITWFDDIEAMRESAKTEAFAATMADEPNFLPGGPVPTIITREHVIVG